MVRKSYPHPQTGSPQRPISQIQSTVVPHSGIGQGYNPPNLHQYTNYPQPGTGQGMNPQVHSPSSSQQAQYVLHPVNAGNSQYSNYPQPGTVQGMNPQVHSPSSSQVHSSQNPQQTVYTPLSVPHQVNIVNPQHPSYPQHGTGQGVNPQVHSPSSSQQAQYVLHPANAGNSQYPNYSQPGAGQGMNPQVHSPSSSQQAQYVPHPVNAGNSQYSNYLQPVTVQGMNPQVHSSSSSQQAQFVPHPVNAGNSQHPNYLQPVTGQGMNPQVHSPSSSQQAQFVPHPANAGNSQYPNYPQPVTVQGMNPQVYDSQNLQHMPTPKHQQMDDPSRENLGASTVWVGDIPIGSTDENLFGLVKEHCKVHPLSTTVMKANGKNELFGFVNCANPEDALLVVSFLDNLLLTNGKRLKANLKTKNSPFQRQNTYPSPTKTIISESPHSSSDSNLLLSGDQKDYLKERKSTFEKKYKVKIWIENGEVRISASNKSSSQEVKKKLEEKLSDIKKYKVQYMGEEVKSKLKEYLKKKEIPSKISIQYDGPSIALLGPSKKLNALVKEVNEYLDDLEVEKVIKIQKKTDSKKTYNYDSDENCEDEEDLKVKIPKISHDMDFRYLKFLVENEKAWKLFCKSFLIRKGTSIILRGDKFYLKGKRGSLRGIHDQFMKIFDQRQLREIVVELEQIHVKYVKHQLKTNCTFQTYFIPEESNSKANFKTPANQKCKTRLKVSVVTLGRNELEESIDFLKKLKKVESAAIRFDQKQKDKMEKLKISAINEYGVDCNIGKNNMVFIYGLDPGSVEAAKDMFVAESEGRFHIEKVNIPSVPGYFRFQYDRDPIFVKLLKLLKFVEKLKEKCAEFKVYFSLFKQISIKGKKSQTVNCSEAIRNMLDDMIKSLRKQEIYIPHAQYLAFRRNGKKIYNIESKYKCLIAWRRGGNKSIPDPISNSAYGTTTTISSPLPISNPSKFTDMSSSLCLELCKWYWMDDDNNWHPFLDEQNDFIEKKRKLRDFKFDMQIENEIYEIDLQKRTQTKKKTNHVRNLKQMEVSSIVEWSWRDDKQKWQKYSLDHSKKIEDAFQKRLPSVDLQLTRFVDDAMGKYSVVFDYENEKHQQVNNSSNYKRLLKREEQKQECDIFGGLIEDEEDDDEDDDEDNEWNSNKKIIIISSSSEAIELCKSELQKLADSFVITETIPAPSLSEKQVAKIVKKYNSTLNSIKNGKAEISGFFTANEKVKISILEENAKCTNNEGNIIYPDEWKAEKEFEVVALDPYTHSAEYARIVKAIQKTIPNVKIIKIERVENQWLWRRYESTRQHLKLKNKNQENEKWLFHGTSGTDPIKIYKGQDGFDMRFSSDGMWGRGTYFAKNASYSNSYAGSDESGHRQFFFARVLLGEITNIPSDRSLRLPPIKNNTTTDSFAEERYDSVEGFTAGSSVFIIYENSRAYPAYLITYDS